MPRRANHENCYVRREQYITLFHARTSVLPFLRHRILYLRVVRCKLFTAHASHRYFCYPDGHAISFNSPVKLHGEKGGERASMRARLHPRTPYGRQRSRVLYIHASVRLRFVEIFRIFHGPWCEKERTMDLVEKKTTSHIRGLVHLTHTQG